MALASVERAASLYQEQQTVSGENQKRKTKYRPISIWPEGQERPEDFIQ
jgi:hypothetical protein